MADELERKIRLIVDAMSRHGLDGRIRATKQLVAIGTVAVPTLVLLLDHPTWSVRQDLVFALGEIGDRNAVEPIIKKLLDGEPGVVCESVIALGKMGGDRAVEVLRDFRQRCAPDLREYVNEALDRARGDQVGPEAPR